MTERFQETLDTVVGLTRRQHDRHKSIRLELCGELVINVGFVRLDLFQKLLQKRVVKIGERFQHLTARLGFPLRHVPRQLDQRGRPALLVLVGPLAHQIDVAGDQITVADRHLPKDQRPLGHILKCRKQIADPLRGLVQFVDDDDVRNVVGVQELQHGQRRRRSWRSPAPPPPRRHPPPCRRSACPDRTRPSPVCRSEPSCHQDTGRPRSSARCRTDASAPPRSCHRPSSRPGWSPCVRCCPWRPAWPPSGSSCRSDIWPDEYSAPRGFSILARHGGSSSWFVRHVVRPLGPRFVSGIRSPVARRFPPRDAAVDHIVGGGFRRWQARIFQMWRIGAPADAHRSRPIGRQVNALQAR